ncbi:hypothetical protein K2X05_09440 [bacterium]|nr:hypothetical protein [bacterium]
MSAAQPHLFSNVPDKDYCDFFKKSELQPEKVVKFLTYKKEDIATATDTPITSVRYDEKMPVELKLRLTEWANAINLVASHFKDLDKTMLWFTITNPMLGDISPRDMIRLGRFKKLHKFIQTALSDSSDEKFLNTAKKAYVKHKGAMNRLK